jgi:hypothetical protein
MMQHREDNAKVASRGKREEAANMAARVPWLGTRARRGLSWTTFQLSPGARSMVSESAIYDLYVKMRDQNSSFGDLYKEGKFWARINENIREILQSPEMKNFRSSPINRKFAGPDPANRQVYRALLNLYYKEIEKIDSIGFLKEHCEPAFGGEHDQELYPFPHGSLLYPFKERRPMSLDFLQSTEEALTIVNTFQKKYGRLPEVIVELGGGYGRLGYVLRKMLPECTYVDIDLPEALVCCHYYLSNVLPGDVVDHDVSSRETTLSRQRLKQGKVWTLGSQEIEKIGDQAADVFVNIYSFAEMPKEVIDNYLGHAIRTTRGLIYIKQRKLENNKFDGVQVLQTDYTALDSWTKTVHRDSTLYPDFFEAMYIKE